MSGLIFKSHLLIRSGKRRAYINNGICSSQSIKSPHYKYGGQGYIAGEAEGIVTVKGQPVSRRIYLFALPKMECIADTWSNPDGSYRFDWLNTEKEYMMVARDYKKQYEPVSYDFIKPYVDSDG